LAKTKEGKDKENLSKSIQGWAPIDEKSHSISYFYSEIYDIGIAPSHLLQGVTMFHTTSHVSLKSFKAWIQFGASSRAAKPTVPWRANFVTLLCVFR